MTLARSFLTAALILALPAPAVAQRAARPMPRVAPGAATSLIALRRQLDLTPRQLAALDSIERVQQRQRQAVRQRLMLRRDSLLAGRAPRSLTPDERAALRTRLDSVRPLRTRLARGDSAARAAAFAVLTDSQRVRARVLLAQRRGHAMGWRAGRARAAGVRPGAGRAAAPPMARGARPLAGPMRMMRRGMPASPPPGAPARPPRPPRPPIADR